VQTIAHHIVSGNAGLRDTLTPLALVLSLSKPAAIIMAGSIVLTWSRGGVISLVAEPLILFGSLKCSEGKSHRNDCCWGSA